MHDSGACICTVLPEEYIYLERWMGRTCSMHDSDFGDIKASWRVNHGHRGAFYNKVKGKGKVVPVLFLTEHHTMKAYWKWRYSSTHSLTSALDGGEWSASRPGRFTLGERAPRTYWIGGWVGPRAVLNVGLKRKIPSPAGNRTLELRLSSQQISALLLEKHELINIPD
jgi:hypothetical protein